MLRWLFFIFRLTVLLLLLGASAAAAYVYHVTWPTLPAIEALRDARLAEPLRLYSADGLLVAQFGELRREPKALAEIPKVVIDAFLATEDANFYEHRGIDFGGIARSVLHIVKTGEKGPGGSTITMQLPRNFGVLGREVTYERKLREMLLALKLERELSKDEILELYLNKIEFGHRAHGVAAAARTYYGKELRELTVAEAAMIAGLPKAPSASNPVRNPERAKLRRDYVLGRMRELNMIADEVYRNALAEVDQARIHEPPVELDAPYVAEMARAQIVELLGEELAYTGGFRAKLTIDSKLQRAAFAAVRQGLIDYDRRHGYRGPEAKVQLVAEGQSERLAKARQALEGREVIAGLIPAIVVNASTEVADLLLYDGREVRLELAQLAWARRWIDADSRGPQPTSAAEVLAPGDIVRVQLNADGGYELQPLPQAQSALVALDPEDGSIRALVGGLSFGRSKFNRAVQSQRQPGSSFKPFVYASAFANGYHPASVFNDAPVVFNEAGMAEAWMPENDSGRFYGPMRLREAMVSSRNLVSVRVLQALGLMRTRDELLQYGLPASALPPNLSFALGSGAIAPIDLAAGYALFANGGYRIKPHLVSELTNVQGKVALPAAARACRDCPARLRASVADAAPNIVLAATDSAAEPEADPKPNEPALAPAVMDERVAFLIRSLLRDVIKRGTGRAALNLERADIGGKTGSTNEHRDAWFAGFHPQLVTVVWTGMDDYSTLGRGEFGGKAALPIWIAFMAEALQTLPVVVDLPPPRVLVSRINRDSGRLLSGPDGDSVEEFFLAENVPAAVAPSPITQTSNDDEDGNADPFEF